VRKPRILWVGEATYTASGYATYYNEVMNRIHATGKYELAELASYGDVTDPRDQRWRSVPWKFYPNNPAFGNDEQQREYDSNTLNQFGSWKFDATLCDFHPDIVVDVRDWWMFEYQERSPLRPYFHWAIMPTVDAIPQHEQWLATFANADAVFTYTDWGMDVLKKASGHKLNLKCPAPPAADMEVFKPVPDKRAHRRTLGFSEDALVIGTVMRNQERKLYPDLIQAFGQFLREAPTHIADNACLHIHACYPDSMGWDLAKLIKEEGVGHKVVFTYGCLKCGAVFPGFFTDARIHCSRCGDYTARMPNSNMGLSREVLAKVFNLFDVYVQYASNEGFGMPMVEAAACGVPVMAIDYSAMEDVVRKVGGTPIKVQRYFRDGGTQTWRALPDNSDFVRKAIAFLEKPAAVRAAHSFKARRGVEKHYSYDKTAQIWMDHFDSVPLQDHALTWNSDAKIFEAATEAPGWLTDEQFVKWGMLNVAGRPDLVNSLTALRMIRDLSWGQTTQQMGGLYYNDMATLGVQLKASEFNREIAMTRFNEIAQIRNSWEIERARCRK